MSGETRISSTDGFEVTGIYEVFHSIQPHIFEYKRMGEGGVNDTSGIIPGEVITLDEALKIAVERNVQLKIQRENITQAQAQYELAKSAKGPDIKIQGSTYLQGPTTSLHIPPPINREFHFTKDFNYFARISLEYILTTFGKIENRQAAAFISVLAEKDNCLATENDIVLNTKEAYFNILKTKNYVNNAYDYLSSAKDHLRIADVLYKEGIVSRFDVVRSELMVSEAEQGVVQAENGHILARSAFLLILNYTGGMPFQTADPEPVRFAEDITLRELQDMALRNRHEPMALAGNIEAAVKLAQAERAGNNPDISFSANYDRQTETVIMGDYSWKTALNFNIPLYDGGTTEANVKNAESAVRALEFTMEGLKKQIMLEVEQAWLELKEAEVRIEASRKDLEKSTEGYRMAKARYMNGLSIAVEMEDALRTLNESRLKLINAEHDFNLALVRLQKAVGMSGVKESEMECK